ncbi:MAG: DUF58 domain-containing protein [Dehalococcoidia bacterium]
MIDNGSFMTAQPSAQASPTANAAPPIPAELLRRVRQIEIRSRRLVTHMFAGQYHSIFRGRGMEFADVREYQTGDEVRSIDWNVTARMGDTFVKRFVEERELTLMLAVDISPSQAFGSSGQTKRDVVAEIAAVLALSAVRHNDKIGLVCFTDRIEAVIPAKKGLRHALRIVRELLYREPEGRGTNINQAVEYVTHLLHRRSIIFLLSDFQDSGFERTLRVAGRRHEMIAVTATDPRETELPNLGLIEVEDAETGEAVLVDTGDRRLRAQYAARAAATREAARIALRQGQIDQIEVSTAEPYVGPLLAYFTRRARLAAKGMAGPRGRSRTGRRIA